MARSTQLKVYRTPIGFHDAYVAASSQKAALKAWGSEHNLFARGEAELVTDEALTTEPLASAGKVVKRLRGSAAEQIAALPPDKPRSKSVGAVQPPKASPKKAPKVKPRPSRAALDAAERAVADAEGRQAEELKELVDREATLAKERRALERDQADELARLTAARERADDPYQRALRNWQG